MKELKITSQFKKDLKKYKPHKLLGDYKDCMECHIESDTLLIWLDENTNVVKLLRLGTHSELFK